MDDTKLSAYRVTQEFLNDTSNVSGKDEKQLLVDTLRRARGVIYQAGLALAPPAPEPDKPTTKPVTFDSGLETQHSPIFESLTTKPGWANGMLFAINTAKKMGCTNFSIEIKETEDRSPQQMTQRGMFGALYGLQDPDDDWRTAAAACFKVTIYAVTIK